ncbi:S8 family serine peptidase, partial [Candidatus Bipolaricaulota bacterium]|nr:S8 family serine peptidase [Candidatus Bipolaricaulota bacterium]
MTNNRFFARFIILLLVLLTPVFIFPTMGQGENAKEQPPPKAIDPADVNPKLQTVLQQMERKGALGLAKVAQFAQSHDITITDNHVTVIIESQSGRAASIDKFKLKQLGGRVEASSKSLLRAKVPVTGLTEITNKVSGLKFIRLPYRSHVQKIDTSEGVGVTDASVFHNAGYTGKGTQIAIIDLGFDHLTEAKDSGDLPEEVIAREVDYTGSGLEAGTNHGTEVAEIVHDMAPEAQLHLMKIADGVDLENAKDDAISGGVVIINHSVAWLNTSYYDGTGLISDIASDARDEGILWINAAGNYAERHWQGNFLGAVGDWQEFGGGDECNDLGVVYSGNRIVICMTWDDWPKSDQDYDLYLYNGEDEEVARSDDFQTGDQPPAEGISYIAENTDDYCVKILNRDAPGAPEIEIFALYHTLEYAVAESSVIDPAVDEKVMAVGAIDHDSWSSGPQEPFSSRGPGNNGVTKPDIMGPDGVSTSGYGTQAFFGTSASSAHIAGAAALLLSQETMTPTSLQNALESDAIDMGTTGKDNIYGSGRLDLSLVKQLSGLEISGPGEVSGEDGNTVEYTATAHYSDGSTETVTNDANWSETFDHASISSGTLVVTSDVSSEELGEVQASYTEDGVTESDNFSVTLTEVNNGTPSCFPVNSGWNLISLPSQPEDKDPASVFDEVFERYGELYLWEYNGGNSWNTVKNGNLTSVDFLGGYYLWLPATTPIDEICSSGEKLSSTQSIDFSDAGWQLFGVPFEVRWGDDGTISLTDGTDTFNLVDAVNEGWIHYKIWELNRDGETFGTTSVSEGKSLEADKGYWV